MEETKQKNIAMFIDCDNVSAKYIESIFDDLSQYGKVNIRKAYGDWSDDKLKGWERILQDYNIQPFQQFSYTQKKNATDIAIVIDVMDSLYTKNIDLIALITSDSDFTPLVTRVLADGKIVYGYGESKTPKALVNACSQFIYVEKFLELQQDNMEVKDLNSEQTEQTETNNDFKNTYRGENYDAKKDYKLKKSLILAVDQVCGESGWADLKDVGFYVSQNSSFSHINHGFKKFGSLIKYLDIFDVKYINNNLTMLIRIKDYID
jgi:uncharacterized protein (TIGR00288 family)